MTTSLQRRTSLRLITGGLGNTGGTAVLSVDEVPTPVLRKRELRAEAEEFAAFTGPNPYSNFILKHGDRPDPNQAAAIGRLMGMQVKASDGTLQPRRTKLERAAARVDREHRKKTGQRHEHILRLKTAIAFLAENKDDPSEIMDFINPSLDEPFISEQLDDALYWLKRFAREWDSRGKQASRTAQPSECDSS